MTNIIELKNNLLNIYLTKLRDRKSNSQEFRKSLKIISTILSIKTFENIGLNKIFIQTPIEKTNGFKLKNEVVLLPILRAGEGMLSSFQEIIQNAKIGFIGLARNEKTLQAEIYLKKIPKLKKNSQVIILDPMLATGGSICKAIEIIKKSNCNNIIVVSVIASPEGIRRVVKYKKDIKIIVGKIDRKLNSKGYIVPGLGDAGDRLYDT